MGPWLLCELLMSLYCALLLLSVVSPAVCGVSPASLPSSSLVNPTLKMTQSEVLCSGSQKYSQRSQIGHFCHCFISSIEAQKWVCSQSRVVCCLTAAVAVCCGLLLSVVSFCCPFVGQSVTVKHPLCCMSLQGFQNIMGHDEV